MRGPSSNDEQVDLDHRAPQTRDHQISALAHQLWMERGCPIGSPDDDWFRAEAELEKVQAEAATA